jgi:site-specific DNA recombinase
VLYKLDDSTEGETLREFLGVFAQMERRKFKERTSRDRKARVTSGLPHGGIAPYGYQWQGERHVSKLVVNDKEAEVVRQVFSWILEGKSIRSIAIQLTRERVPSRGDNFPKTKKALPPGCWSAGVIYSLLHYEGYIGTRWHGRMTWKDGVVTPHARDEWTAIPMPPIVEEETFQAVAKQLEKNKRTSPRNRRYEYLLGSETFRCGRCGRGMTGFTSPGHHSRYRCNSQHTRADGKHCRGSLLAWRVETHVWLYVEHVLRHPEIILDALDLARKGSDLPRESVRRRLAGLDERLEEMRQERAQLVMLGLKKLVTDEEMQAQGALLDAERQALLEDYSKA